MNVPSGRTLPPIILLVCTRTPWLFPDNLCLLTSGCDLPCYKVRGHADALGTGEFPRRLHIPSALLANTALILPTSCEGTLFLFLKPSSHVHLSLTHQPRLCSLGLDVRYESTLVNPALLSRTPCFALGIHSRF